MAAAAKAAVEKEVFSFSHQAFLKMKIQNST